MERERVHTMRGDEAVCRVGETRCTLGRSAQNKMGVASRRLLQPYKRAGYKMGVYTSIQQLVNKRDARALEP